MQTGAITGYIDVAQLVLYAFWLFFFGLVIWIRREDKREGYPLESDLTERSAGRTRTEGFPSIPAPKSFKLEDGETLFAPNFKRDGREVKARPIAGFPGAPLEPTGNPLVDAVGPASYAERRDIPDMTLEGEVKMVPLRVATDFVVESRDPDPRGMALVGADGVVAGKLVDVWVDRAEHLARYYEAEVAGAGGMPRRILVPVPFTTISRASQQVTVRALKAAHFADVPALKNPDQVTFLEEDRITGYYGGGQLYADPQRLEPLL